MYMQGVTLHTSSNQSSWLLVIFTIFWSTELIDFMLQQKGLMQRRLMNRDWEAEVLLSVLDLQRHFTTFF
jgi:hypothetical protein